MNALGIIAIVAGVALGLFGGLQVMAGGMSDAPVEGDAVAKSGGRMVVGGAFLVVAGIAALVL